MIPDSKALSKGTDANTVYAGYAPAASLTLMATASGGSGVYAYKWSTGATSTSITVSPALATTYTLTVTDGSSCTAAASKQVKVLNAGSGAKVNVCHGGKILSIDKVSVTDHLNHGDKLASCSTAGSTASATSQAVLEESLPGDGLRVNAFRVKLYPNPTKGQFVIELHLANDISEAKVQLINIMGAIVSTENANISNGILRKTILIPSSFSSGTYLVKVAAGNKTYLSKLIYEK